MQQLFVKLFDPKPNGPETAWLLANLLQVKIPRSTLKKEIEEHPDYPSLLSISDGPNNYGIETQIQGDLFNGSEIFLFRVNVLLTYNITQWPS